MAHPISAGESHDDLVLLTLVASRKKTHNSPALFLIRGKNTKKVFAEFCCREKA